MLNALAFERSSCELSRMGLAVGCPVPCRNRSVPVVILNGVPVWATRKGDKRIRYFVVTEPPRNRLCETFRPVRPTSALKFEGLEGRGVSPSVSLCAFE